MGGPTEEAHLTVTIWPGSPGHRRERSSPKLSGQARPGRQQQKPASGPASKTPKPSSCLGKWESPGPPHSPPRNRAPPELEEAAELTYTHLPPYGRMRGSVAPQRFGTPVVGLADPRHSTRGPGMRTVSTSKRHFWDGQVVCPDVCLLLSPRNHFGTNAHSLPSHT